MSHEGVRARGHEAPCFGHDAERAAEMGKRVAGQGVTEADHKEGSSHGGHRQVRPGKQSERDAMEKVPQTAATRGSRPDARAIGRSRKNSAAETSEMNPS